MHKRPGDGIVRVDTISASAVDISAWSCPYGAPQLNEQTGQMSKCDFAWICGRKANSLSAWQPVPLKQSNSGRLMNFGRNTVW